MNVNTDVISESQAISDSTIRSTTPAPQQDAGCETLRYIHRRLQIDDEWTERRERGFTWWAHRLAQHVDAGRPIDDDGIVVTRITSRIPVLQGVKADRDSVETILADWNFVADCYCYVYDPEARTIESVQSGIVHDQTLDWRPELLAAQFMVQLCHAEEDASALRRVLGGRLAISRHPQRGRRKAPDDMLNVVWAVFRPRGEGNSLFADKFEFETIFEQTQRINAASFGAAESGIAIEVPFGTGTALITLNAGEPNPRIGAGLGVFLQLPIWGGVEECARLAAWLNREEAGGEFLSQCWGAWSVKKHGDACTVSRCGFVPNALHRPGLAMDLAAASVMKLRQVNRRLNPGIEEPVAWRVVSQRLGLQTSAGECQGARPDVVPVQ